jgi:hypothetical protein
MSSTELPLATEEELEAFRAWQEESARRAVDEMVNRAAAESADGYRGLLSDLALDGTTIDQLQSNLVALHYMAVDAGDPLTELAIARSRYDEYMRSLLDEDAYKRYRKYEESKPAVREYEMIKEYAAVKRGVMLDEGETAKLVDLIRDAGATTTESWHGPYDPLPRPIAGAEAIDKLQTDYLSLVNSADSLLASAYEAGVPEELLHILKEYYTDKTQAGHDKWIYWNRPIEDIRAEIRVRAGQEMIDPQSVVSP